ncbi:MAG: NUDIX hydrolase [Flavobacteriaceae bacterium]|nr:NUDIX hydrolase [Flavobacteriaceae bacterium]
MILAASAIILQNNKILLLQRSNYTEHYPLYWGCPGGRAVAGETAEENVIREVKEECGLDFKPTEILKKGVWEAREFFRFLGTWSGEITIQEEEVLAYDWYSYAKAMELPLSFDYREILELLHEKGLLK